MAGNNSGVSAADIVSPLHAGQRRNLQPDFAEIDARTELRLDRPLGAAGGGNLDEVRTGILVQLVEFEVAVVVAHRLRDGPAVLAEADARAFDAIDDAVRLGRQRAADEAFRIAPEIAVVDTRLGPGFRLHHLEPLLARDARHLRILDLDRAHGAGRAGLLAAGLLPALIEEVGVERPDLRKLQLLVPPDVAVGTALDQILAPPRFLRVDEHDAVVALLYGVAALRHARRVVAVIAHGRNVGDVDHRHLPSLLLQDVDPLMAVLGHRRRIPRPGVADIFIHDRQGAEVAIGALGHVDDHVPFLHRTYPLVAGLEAVMTADAVTSPARAARLSASRAPLCPAPCARRSPTCARSGRPRARPAPANWPRRSNASTWSACAPA